MVLVYIGYTAAFLFFFKWVFLAIGVFFYLRKHLTVIYPVEVLEKKKNGEVSKKIVYKRFFSRLKFESFKMLCLVRLTNVLLWLKAKITGEKYEGRSNVTESNQLQSNNDENISSDILHLSFSEQKFSNEPDLPKAKKYRSGDFM